MTFSTTPLRITTLSIMIFSITINIT
jgi:hypothetical protein